MNGWWLNVQGRDLSETLRKVISRISDDWREEYLEVESTPAEIAAYWEEWGGATQARRIKTYLTELWDAERQ